MCVCVCVTSSLNPLRWFRIAWRSIKLCGRNHQVRVDRHSYRRTQVKTMSSPRSVKNVFWEHILSYLINNLKAIKLKNYRKYEYLLHSLISRFLERQCLLVLLFNSLTPETEELLIISPQCWSNLGNELLKFVVALHGHYYSESPTDCNFVIGSVLLVIASFELDQTKLKGKNIN